MIGAYLGAVQHDLPGPVLHPLCPIDHEVVVDPEHHLLPHAGAHHIAYLLAGEDDPCESFIHLGQILNKGRSPISASSTTLLVTPDFVLWRGDTNFYGCRAHRYRSPQPADWTTALCTSAPFARRHGQERQSLTSTIQFSMFLPLGLTGFLKGTCLNPGRQRGAHVSKSCRENTKFSQEAYGRWQSPYAARKSC